MKRVLKLSIIISLIFSLTLSTLSLIYAWDAPKVDKAYVEEETEFRGVWVCTVSNMDVSIQTGTDEKAINLWKKQYLDILDNAVRMKFNAIIFQVRPCNDAFYPSKYNPWSQYLAGFGVDPGWDPVEWMVEVTHSAGLEYHAWLNPYRTSTTTLGFNIKNESGKIYDYDKKAANEYKHKFFGDLKKQCEALGTSFDNPIFYEGEELDHAVLYGSEDKFILNPAAESTVTLLENTITELVTNYDIDGIHFDDYFYPSNASYYGTNPDFKALNEFSCEPDVDLADYNAFIKAGGVVPQDDRISPELNAKRIVQDWRRMNVDNLIQSLSNIIREANKSKSRPCSFGISPAARWAPNVEYCSIRGAVGGMGGSGDCNNYYSFSDLYANVYKWCLEGWLDYILPQCYTNLGTSNMGTPSGSYDSLVKWWSEALEGVDTLLYIGTPAYQVSTWNSSKKCTTMELYWQLRWNQYKGYNESGYVMFRYDSLINGINAIAMTNVNKYLWKIDALTPLYKAYDYPSLDKHALVKELTKDISGNYYVYFDKVEGAKAYGLLEDDKVITRSLNSDNPLVFVPDTTKTYKLITYGFDNKVVSECDIVDLNNLKPNNAPKVECKTVLDKEYEYRTNIDCKFTCSDEDNDKLIYTCYFMHDGIEQLLEENYEVTNGTIVVEFKTSIIDMKDCYFKVIVTDSFDQVIVESNKFNVVSEIIPTCDHEHLEWNDETEDTFGYYYCEICDTYFDEDLNELDSIDKPIVNPPVVNPPSGNDKKKCGKKAAILFVSLIAATQILIIFRKKN